MSSQTVSVCFTDLKGSTESTRRLGNEVANRLKREHLRYVKCLAGVYGCPSPKDVGDGVMAWFDEHTNAAFFAAEVLAHDEVRPGIARSALGVKVGIERGEVEIEPGDIKGDAANVASRVQGFADEGCAYYGPEFRKALVTHWGEDKVSALTLASQDVQPKGIEPIEIFKLDWKQLDSEHGLRGHRALEGIRRAGLQRYNIEKDTLKTGGTIIWPVVPRSLVTAIHRAQLEIIHHLARYCDSLLSKLRFENG